MSSEDTATRADNTEPLAATAPNAVPAAPRMDTGQTATRRRGSVVFECTCDANDHNAEQATGEDDTSQRQHIQTNRLAAYMVPQEQYDNRAQPQGVTTATLKEQRTFASRCELQCYELPMNIFRINLSSRRRVGCSFLHRLAVCRVPPELLSAPHIAHTQAKSPRGNVYCES